MSEYVKGQAPFKYGFGPAFALIGVVVAALIGIVVFMTFDRPSPVSVQGGFRGTGMDTVYNPRELQTYLASNKVPALDPVAGQRRAAGRDGL